MYVMKEKACGGDIQHRQKPCGGDIQRRQKPCGGDIQRRLYRTADPGLCIYGAVLFNRSWTRTKNCLLFLLPRQGTKENKNKNKVI